MKQKNKRFLTLTILMVMISLGFFILLSNLRENIIFFYSPSEVFEKSFEKSKKIRVGGMVKVKSLRKKIKEIDGRKLEEISFIITDYNKEILILYVGILPDLFKEGQGVVVEGIVEGEGIFKATTVLAKHDENYMPPEIKNIPSIKESKNGV